MFEIGNIAQPETGFETMTIDDLQKLTATEMVQITVVADGWGRPDEMLVSAQFAERIIRDRANRTHTIEVIFASRLSAGLFPGSRFRDFHPETGRVA